MDYQFRIELAEKELAHLREMQTLIRARQDAHEQSLDASAKRFERIEITLEKLAAAQLVTEQKLQSLITLLVREHGNGGGRS